MFFWFENSVQENRGFTYLLSSQSSRNRGLLVPSSYHRDSITLFCAIAITTYHWTANADIFLRPTVQRSEQNDLLV